MPRGDIHDVHEAQRLNESESRDDLIDDSEKHKKILEDKVLIIILVLE